MYGKCTCCKKQLKYEKSKNNIYNNDIEIICKKCFDIEKYTLIDDDILEILNNLNFKLQISMSSKEFYLNKIEWSKISNLKRKQKLIDKLTDYKLSYDDYENNQLCKSYINNGHPNLDTVIKSLYSKLSIENNRLCDLLETLKSLNLEYDPKIPSYKKYIKKGGNINKIIDSAELEKDLIKNTNYLSLYDITDSDTAKEIVVGKIEIKTKCVEKYIATKNTIKFD